MQAEHHQLMVLGSGPAGCTAALYAARANLATTLVTGATQGGQLTGSSLIENWPGEAAGISGAALMERMLQQVKRFNAQLVFDQITAVDLRQRPFQLRTAEVAYSCDALIIALGASPKYLGLPSEAVYLGGGISTCAVCDGFFYRNKDVVVIGGGNTAIEEALYLAELANSVTVVHRRAYFTAEAVMVERLQAQPKIRVLFQHVVTEFFGDQQGITAVGLQHVNGSSAESLAAAGVFIAIGYQPNTELFTGQLALADGYIKTGYTGGASATSVIGVFAAGDIVHNSYRQAVVAAGGGCIAALDALNFLRHSMANN